MIKILPSTLNIVDFSTVAFYSYRSDTLPTDVCVWQQFNAVRRTI